MAKKFVVKLPNNDKRSLVSRGIAFQSGKAEIEDEWLAQMFKESGYLVDGKEVEVKPAAGNQNQDQNEKDLKKEADIVKEQNDAAAVKFNRKAAMETLKEKGVPLKATMTNDQLEELLAENK